MTFDTLTPIGNAILDSFWWITVAAVMLAVCLRLLPGMTPSRRYFVASGFLLTALGAFLSLLRFDDEAGSVLLPPLSTGPLPAALGGASFDSTDWAQPLAIAWLCGVILLSLRTFGGWVYLRLLIRRATPCAWPSLDPLARRIGVRRAVELRSSSRGDSPFTAGWRRPVIVVPLATIAGLPADQFEAILLHELAHIRRFDYVAEWGLQAMETLFFYHPAVWWMTAMVRRERERSCDDMAIAAGADRACYARALVGLEEMRVPMLANGGAGSDLQGRVARILGERSRPAAWPALVLLALTVVAQQAKTPYERWVRDDAAYIIQSWERLAFELLKTDAEREAFIGQFWERRDPTPGTDINEMKEEHYRRIAYANERFWEKGKEAGWQTERGRTYILFGPPDEMETHPNEKREKWFYKSIAGVGTRVTIEFVNGVRK